MRSPRGSLLCAALLVAPATAVPTTVRADVGVIATIVEGFDADSAEGRRAQLDRNVATTLGQSFVQLELKPGCDGGTAAQLPDPKCVQQAAATSKVDVDEVAQVVLRRTGPNLTEMTLRIFGRDGIKQQELKTPIVDSEAVDATTAMLRKAFDPSKYSGEVFIRGAPPRAELLVDGLRLEQPHAHLRVGKHILDIVHVDGSVETVSFELAFGEKRDVPVQSAPIAAAAPAGAPLLVSASTAGVGALAVVGAVVLGLVANDNETEWERRAQGTTFPRNEDDPLCAATQCADEDDTQRGWTAEYGPLGPSGQVGQGARFMMVALSRDNQLRWDSTVWAALGLGVAGAVSLVGGVAGTFALWPAGETSEATE